MADFTPTPVEIDVEAGAAYAVFDCFVTGQPTDPAGLTQAAGLGVRSVICLRDPSETATPEVPGFDTGESETLIGLGVAYVDVPFPHDITLAQFCVRATIVRQLVAQCPRPLLMHCSTGDRASALWAVHLWVDEGLPLPDAVALAKQSGLANPTFVQFVESYAPPVGPTS